MLYFRTMYQKCCCSLLLIFLCCTLAKSQNLPFDRHTKKAYQNHTRDQNGTPGKAYWQNQGDYQIDVSFDPATRKLSGTVEIAYVNNSPDTLKKLAFKLYPNLYKSNTMRNTVISTADLGTGVHISELKIDGRQIDSTRRIMRGTNMDVKGVTVLPHQKITATVTYEYLLNKGSFNRTGQIDNGSFFIAYFFPRIAVYDDIDGWNEYAYMGKEEFYNDYGNFKVSIRVPGDFSVWATGDLKNQDEVFQKIITERIGRAEKGDQVIDVITKDDLKNKLITLPAATHVWRFEATNVTDFAFAVSNNYTWKASSVMVDSVSKRRTRVDAVYNPEHKSYTPVVNYNRKTVELISHRFPNIPFPYSHETIVDGLDAMEYPMMVNNLPFEDPKDVVEFTAHEVFHSLFPFYVSTNETKFSFMDEGWATLTEFMFHPWIAPEVPLDYDISAVNDAAGLAEDVPLVTPTAQLYGTARFADKDLKPALALWYLKTMIGDKKFAEATGYYIRTWAGKHPTPYDFFNCLNKGTNINLDWYWKRWYFEKSVPDLAIKKVSAQQGKYRIVIANIGGAPVPIHLTVYLANGKQLQLSKPVSAWQTTSTCSFSITPKIKIIKIVLGDAYDADIDSKNNTWNTTELK